MSENISLSPNSTRWGSFLLIALKDGTVEERRMSLEFLGLQTVISEEEARAVFPIVQDLLFHDQAEIRYFAHKAVNRLQEFYPALKLFRADEVPPGGDYSGLSQRDILLQKIRLGSRYVAFDALERLTESRDPTLADPLLAFLAEEKDPFKISFLVKRLCRIPDPRVPETLVRFLEHSDFRVVANTLEGLSDLDLPALKTRYAALATSLDHRVRGAAVQVLMRYDRPAAISNLRGMLAIQSIAFQETSLYILRHFQGPEHDELLDIAMNSRFPSIRMGTLEIAREAVAPQTPSPAPPSSLSDAQRVRGLIVTLVLAAGLMLIVPAAPPGTAFNLFIITSLGVALWFRRSEGNFSRGVATVALIANLVWGDVHFFPLLGILAIWVPLPAPASSDRVWQNRLAVWIFATIAVVATHFLRDETVQTLDLVGTLMASSKKVDSGVALALGQMQTFNLALFFILSVYLVFLLKLEYWLPPRPEQPSGQKRLMIVFGVGLLILLVMLISHSLGLSLTMRVNGLSSPAQVFKRLME